ncbi:M20 metallopeptidase family protein [Alkalihalobacillus trypoxylicola]|uniref:Peptidase M20 n=1 Tax=Alkalihalobacillus trypoxylicola TaxID=519424 RepID=A0A161PJF7_9BACI|nr:amidohydrolase [Alkalihalobacillus trypoxylicola]KYG29421.1 peptidase M20 [Alkalihalobacillus trypoxylicola]
MQEGERALSIKKLIHSQRDHLVKWRRHIHQYPELSFKEFETARYIKEELSKNVNIKIETAIGLSTSVIGHLHAENGPTLAIRADIDALPIQEENEVSYCSSRDGVMHACGHDAHTAILLGVAHVLSELARAGQLKGNIKFIFQPAEETPDEHGLSGSSYLINAGVYDQVSAALALHMCPWLPLGSVQINDGYSMANVDEFEAVIKGTGGHGGYPEKGTDPTWMLGLLLQAIHGIVPRKVSALEHAVISIGEIQAGTATNIIPTDVRLRGTIRSYHPSTRQLLENQLQQAFSVIKALEGDYQLTIKKGEPALYNDPFLNKLVRSAVKKIDDAHQIITKPYGMGGEDFGFVAQKLPASMFFLGCSDHENKATDLHTPTFNIDEAALELGVEILVYAVIDYFEQFHLSRE